MVDSISGGNFRPPPPQQRTLTDEQSTKLDDILKDFDTENLSDEDASSIVSALHDAGIGPSKGLFDKLAESGIDAKSLGKQAGVQDQNRPSGPPPAEIQPIESSTTGTGTSFNSINITV